MASISITGYLQKGLGGLMIIISLIKMFQFTGIGIIDTTYNLLLTFIVFRFGISFINQKEE